MKSDCLSHDVPSRPQSQEPRTQEASCGARPLGDSGGTGTGQKSLQTLGLKEAGVASSHRPRPSGIKVQGQKELQPSFCGTNKG